MEATVTDYQCAMLAMGAVEAAAHTSEALAVLTLDGEKANVLDKAEQLAAFVRVAGDAPPEAVFRFASAQGLHPFPGDAWAGLTPDVRIVVEIFTAVCKAVRPIYDPPAPRERVIVAPAAPPVRREDTIFEEEPAMGERESGAAPAPFKVVSLKEAQERARDTAALAANNSPPDFARIVFAPEDMAHIGRPVGEEGAVVADVAAIQRQLAASREGTLDELRAQRRAADPNSVDNVMRELPGAAPEAEAGEERTIEATVGGERIAGQVKVTKTKPRR
jgi:hypothetical protein